MKRNVNRLFALLLAVVMVVAILPMTAKNVSAEGDSTPLDTYKASLGAMTDVIYENDMDTDNPIVSNPTHANFELDSTVSESGADTSVKLAYKATATPQTYFNLDLEKNLVPGNIYTLRVWYKTSDPTIGRLIRIYQGSGSQAGATDGSFGEKGHAQFYTNKANIIGNDDKGVEVILSMRATETVNTKRLSIMLGAFGLTTDPAGSVWYDNLVITETWTVENALKYGKDVVALTDDTDLSSFVQFEGANAGDIVIAEGQTLDLNGHKLTANSVTVAAGGKIIDSSNAEGRLNASLVCSAENTYLPLNAEDGYLFVQPKMDDTYVKTSHSVGGFEIALRPGFGKFDGDKSVREHILSQSNAGVTLTVSVAWKDVYGQTGEKTVKAFTDEEFTQVYSSTSGKYFYTKFTNPGESQYYDVTLTLVSNGVRVSRTLHFNNLAEVNKTYLFAHNFDGISEYSRDDKSYYYLDSMRGESNYIKTDKAYAIPTFADGALYMNGADKANQIWLFGIPSHDSESKAVVTFKFRVMLDSSDTYNRSGLTLLDIRSTPRMTLASANTGANNSGQFYLYEKNAEGATVKNHYIGQALTPDVWYDVEIVMDYANDTISLAIGENVVSTTLAEFAFSKDAYASQYFLMTRTAAYDQYFLDDLRLSYTNG